MKSTWEGINSRSDDAEEWISNQKDRIIEVKQLDDQKEKRIKNYEDF